MDMEFISGILGFSTGDISPRVSVLKGAQP